MVTSEVGSNEHFYKGHSLLNVAMPTYLWTHRGLDLFCACTFVSLTHKTPIESQGLLYFHEVDEAR